MNICLCAREKKCLHIATSNLDPPHSTDGFQHMLKLLKRSSTASKERWVGWRVAHPRNVWGPCWLIWKNEVFVSMQKKKKRFWLFGYSRMRSEFLKAVHPAVPKQAGFPSLTEIVKEVLGVLMVPPCLMPRTDYSFNSVQQVFQILVNGYRFWEKQFLQ